MKRFVAAVLLFLVAAPVRPDEKTESKIYEVPYRLTSTSHVLIRVKINGKGPYNFILDTGAPTLFVSTAVCRKLGIRASKKGLGTFDRFEIEGGVVLEKCQGRIEDPFQLEGMNGLGIADAELHGIVGYTILARYRLGFDFTKSKMTWQPLNFEPPPPEGMDEPATAGGGSILKFITSFLGKKNDSQIVTRGFWGAVLDESPSGVVVKAVLEDGPAANAGLKSGDGLVRMRGKMVRSIADVQSEAAKLGPGETLDVEITRGHSSSTIRMKTGKGL
jgi:hypothetical protein